MKDVNKTTSLSVPSGTPTQLTASWIGNYSWSTGETTRTITVSAVTNTSYTVTDGIGCITDVFDISINANRSGANRFTETKLNIPGKILPSFAKRGEPVLVRSGNNEAAQVIISDANGRIIYTQKFINDLTIQTSRFHTGIYYIKLSSKLRTETLKLIVID